MSSKAGALRATMSAIDADGRALEHVIALSRARVVVLGSVLALQAPASSLRVKMVARHLAGARELEGRRPLRAGERPASVTQTVPESGELELRTHRPPRPVFARDGHLRLSRPATR